jgi:Tol biopolymer transport system component
MPRLPSRGSRLAQGRPREGLLPWPAWGRLTKGSLPLLLALAATLLCCGSAEATFTPFALTSADPEKGLQADFAYDPAISADGRYVAFTGSIASRQGIYRKELATGRLELIAAGDGAGAPSISANGQYVSFTTDQNPVTGQATGACSSVYVRNMQVAPEQPQNQTEAWRPEGPPPAAPGEFEHVAFTLVSAGDGSPESLTYAPEAGRECGSASAARVALSADGEQVAFTVLSPSSLTGACELDEETATVLCPTPPYQVAVRDLKSEATTLVSSTLASQQSGQPQPVPDGAALAGPTTSGVVSLRGGGHARLAVGGSTAAISADGSAVAWMGIEIAAQAPVAQPLPRVQAGTEKGVPIYYPDSYAEPLWRQISAGPGAPTRRVLAGDDASAPGCPPACPGGVDLAWDTQSISGNEYVGAAPQYGSYTSEAQSSTGFASGVGLQDSLAAVTPQLSEDGMTVALLSTQPNYGEDPNFGLLDATRAPPANAFVVNMAPGLTRAQAITRLTDWASLDFSDGELAAPVTSIALSGDGTRVVFATERIAFPLAPPALITPILSQAAVAQLYEANLLGGTLALVTFGYNGQPANEEVFAAALSGDGHTIALASGATNLAYGVVNQGSDVFATEEIHSPAVPGQQSVGPTPPWPAAEVPWSLSATVTPSPDGTLDLYVSVPGAGRLGASAVSAMGGLGVPSVSIRARKSAKRRAHRATTARNKRSAPRKRGSRHTRQSGKDPSPAGTLIAHTSASTKGAETIELHLVPATRYDSLLRASRYGLYTTITLMFAAPGHGVLRETLRANFPRRPPFYNLPVPGYPLPKVKQPRHVTPRSRRGRPSRTHRGGRR